VMRPTIFLIFRICKFVKTVIDEIKKD